jgi:lysozyme
MINKESIDLIKFYESCELEAYECATSKSLPPGKKFWTIGWGNTFYADGRAVHATDKITQEEADKLFKDVLKTFEDKVLKAVQVPLTENQLGALTSFAYNCGIGNLNASTLLKKVNAKDYAAAAKEFHKWNKSNGKVLKGLVARREKESQLFEHVGS